VVHTDAALVKGSTCLYGFMTSFLSDSWHLVEYGPHLFLDTFKHIILKDILNCFVHLLIGVMLILKLFNLAEHTLFFLLCMTSVHPNR
jgi:hypothetical protein